MRFKDRKEAGELLAQNIEIVDPENTVVLGLPRGGVPLAIIIAHHHSVAMDVILAKKIGHPMHLEFAIGAIAEGGEPLVSEAANIEDGWIDRRVGEIREEMARRRTLYNQVLVKHNLADKDIIIVDDGIATGRTMFAAIEAARQQNPRTISVAVPVIPSDTYASLVKVIDQVYYYEVPDQFLGSVGAYYVSFPQVSDDEVQTMLKEQRVE